MQWTLHSLISLLCVASLSAKRLHRHDVALAEFEASSDRSNDRNARNGSDGRGEDRGEVGHPGHPCLQEEPLKAVMKGLGVKDKELQHYQHLRDHPWTRWKDCRVVQLDIPTPVQGSLDERIRELVDLQHVILFGSNLTGDVALLKENTELNWIWMRDTSVFGDLQSLSALRKLERLNLRGTKVYGDLKSLSMEFKWLDVSNTKVSGDLKTLRTAKLENLHLWGTQVTGDLASLATATQMTFLGLSDTEISGHLASLSNLAHLWKLNLARTKVIGDLSIISAWQELDMLDLSDTQITGEFTKDWSKLRSLFQLDLARTKVRILDTSWLQNSTPIDKRCPFPKLKSLDISGTPLFCTVDEFLGSFAGCAALHSLKAKGCGLTGPMQDVQRDARRWSDWPLTKVLRWLDMSSNNVIDVQAFPESCRRVILAGNPAIALGPRVLQQATDSITSLDLRNTTFNPSDVAHLLESGVVKKTATRTVYNEEHGFACYGNTNALLEISPEQFAPDQLCSCFPGWKGSGAQCQKCPQDSFTENYSCSECEKCPPGSKAPAGATSRSSCVCDVGVLYSSKGSWKCGCPEHEALLEDICVKCVERGLDCSLPGSDVLSARPLPGFTRLYKETRAFKCLAPDTRCNANSANLDVYQGYNPSCAEGYTGVMCMECAPKYFATRSRCRRCQNATAFRNGALMILGSLVLVLVAIGVGIWLWIRRMRSQKGPGPLIALREQLKVQAPILLQLSQLWGVLALLATEKDDPGISVGASLGVRRVRERLSTFWEVPYVEVLQLSISSFQDIFNLQCRFDGAMVRFVFALAAPVVPLVILLCCVVLELRKPGSGINVGLKALTLFYVAGASSTARLLSCQETDGAGDSLPRQFAFRTLMPYVRCHEESALKRHVDLVAFSCAFFWAIVIPCCLLHVYRRQDIILQASRTTVALATDQGSLKVSVSEVLGSNIQKEFVRRLVAAAAAYIAVLYRGRVQVQIVRGTATVKQLDARDSDAENVASDFSDFFSFSGRVDTQQRAKQLKCRNIANMLTERAILDALARDRVLIGAKSVLHKYSSCRNIWMEILQKLVVMALISIVATEGFVLSITVTLTMAATSSMVQPYLQPQVNTLHRCSFLCLAVSAVSFSHGWVWPCRAALVFPFLLTTAQALRPDSPEGLAVRLWQELEPQIEALQHGEAIEVMAEIYSFI